MIFGSTTKSRVSWFAFRFKGPSLITLQSSTRNSIFQRYWTTEQKLLFPKTSKIQKPVHVFLEFWKDGLTNSKVPTTEHRLVRYALLIRLFYWLLLKSSIEVRFHNYYSGTLTCLIFLTDPKFYHLIVFLLLVFLCKEFRIFVWSSPVDY